MTKKPLSMITIVVAFVLLLAPCANCDKKLLHFTSMDGVSVSADLYMEYPQKRPFVILFHRAGWSRGEYVQIAPRLVKMGFNCMAVDLRSGGSINGVRNMTAISAKSLGKKTGFLDAEKDVLAAVSYARKGPAKGVLILWGSSYSASLVIKAAAEHPKLCDGLLLFSPGEYFERFGKGKGFVRQKAGSLRMPVFITSHSREKDRWWAIYNAIPSKSKSYFIPDEDGAHGSEALWPTSRKNGEYWHAVESFLRHFLSKDLFTPRVDNPQKKKKERKK